MPTTNEIFQGDASFQTGPYGLGVRVPMIVVSPWTRGGWVNSQLFDHTSMIQFLERRFAGGNPDLIESNVTPWRRAVVGDLTSAFNFKKPNSSWKVKLPDTDDFKPEDLVRFPDEMPVPPADPELPGHHGRVRPAAGRDHPRDREPRRRDRRGHRFGPVLVQARQGLHQRPRHGRPDLTATP